MDCFCVLSISDNIGHLMLQLVRYLLNIIFCAWYFWIWYFHTWPFCTWSFFIWFFCTLFFKIWSFFIWSSKFGPSICTERIQSSLITNGNNFHHNFFYPKPVHFSLMQTLILASIKTFIFYSSLQNTLIWLQHFYKQSKN